MRVLTLPLLVFMAALAKDVSSADTNPIVTISATSTVTATDMPRFITTTKSFTETETEITTETEVKTKTKTGIKTEIKTGTETETETETTTTVLTSKLTHTTSITVVSKPPRTTTRAYTTTTMTYTTTAVSTATSVLTVTAAQTNVLAMNVHPEAWREVTKPKVENIQWTGCNQCGRSTHDYHLYKSIDFFCKGGSDGQFGGRLKDGLLWPNSTIGLALWVNTTHPREGEIPLEKEKGGLLVRVIVTTFKSYPGNYIDMFHLGRQACIDMLSTVVTGCHLGPDDPHSYRGGWTSDGLVKWKVDPQHTLLEAYGECNLSFMEPGECAKWFIDESAGFDFDKRQDNSYPCLDVDNSDPKEPWGY